MDRAKWRILHAPHGTAGGIDAKGNQQVYRCCSSRPRTGIKLNRPRSCWIDQRRRKRSTIADAHRGNGKCLAVRADERLTTSHSPEHAPMANCFGRFARFLRKSSRRLPRKVEGRTLTEGRAREFHLINTLTAD